LCFMFFKRIFPSQLPSVPFTVSTAVDP
jgi:hypothetical protein